jgi:hypothetical protein
VTPPSTAAPTQQRNTTPSATGEGDDAPVQTEGMSAEAKAILGRIADFDLMGASEPSGSPAKPAPPASPPPKGRSPQPRKGRATVSGSAASVVLNVDDNDEDEPKIVDLPERERPPQMVTFGTSSDASAAAAAAPPSKRKFAEPIACGDDTPLPVDGPPPNSQPMTVGPPDARPSATAALPRRATAASAVGSNSDDVRDTVADTAAHGSIVRPRGAADVPFNPPQGWDDPNASSIRRHRGGAQGQEPASVTSVTASGPAAAPNSVKPMARPISKAFAARLSATTRAATQSGLYFDHIMEQVAAVMQEAA